MHMQGTANFDWRLGTLCLLMGLCWTRPVAADEQIGFSAEQLMAHVKQLADESMLGRKAGTPFERRAAEYVGASWMRWVWSHSMVINACSIFD